MSNPPTSRKATIQSQKLADGMLETLSKAKQSVNPDSYPMTFPITLSDLASNTDKNANDDLVKKAARTKKFCEKAIAARQGDLLAPVALLTDLPQLAESHQLLRYLLNLRAKNKTRAHTVASLKKELTKHLKQPFGKFVTSQIKNGKLPSDVGCVDANQGKPHLFRLEDLKQESWRAAIKKSQPNSSNQPFGVSDFAQEFGSSFAQLDQAQGGYNFVTLAELRTSLPGYSREEFDSRLRELRQARRYRLSGAENRSDVSAQQRDAGIREAGSLLLYAQRIKS